VKEFSIFDYALEFSAGQADNLGEVANVQRKEFAERESFLCHTTTAAVEYACLMIENALLLRTNRAGRVYAGFEKFSQLQPIIDRYLRIADVSESVFIFGADDWQNHMKLHTGQMEYLSKWLVDNGKIAKMPDVKSWENLNFIPK